MTERILGPKGPVRRGRMWFLPIVLLLSAAVLFTVSAASAADPDAGTYTIVVDENGPNDVPGQKDLTLQGVDKSGLATGTLKVLWNWDERGTSGNNSMDACTLFDTDGDSRANNAVCVITNNNPATLTGAVAYSCGDTRVDRCTSPIAVISAPVTTASCTINNNSSTDPFPGPAAKDKGASYPIDTRGKCTIKLSEINATTATLINTCSYPSSQPNSDPSDCVLIPRDAFLTIVKVADPSNQGSFPFSLDGTAVFTASGSQTSSAIGITTANNATHSVAENTPSGWTLDTASCTGATGSNGTKSGSTISGIDPSPDDNITCTFHNTLQKGNINVTKSGSDSGAQTGAVFTLYSPAGVDANNVPTGSSVGTCTVVASGQCGSNPSFSNLLPGNYTLDETTVPAGYTKPATLPALVAVTSGSTTSVSFTDAANPGSAAISKLDDAGDPVVGAVFTVYSPAGVNANNVPTGNASGTCTTGATGSCTISSLASGSYTIDEVPPSGYAKDATFPKTISITNGNTTNVSATDPRQFKVVVLVCRQSDDTLYSSAVKINGDTRPDSLSAAGATTAGLSAADQTALCGLSAGAKGGLTRAGNDHSAAITIP
jgi:Prealbumin-like fold domain